MAESSVIPETNLKHNDYNILKILTQFEEYLELDDQRRNSLHSICIQRIRDNSKKAKKSFDLLDREWWIILWILNQI